MCKYCETKVELGDVIENDLPDIMEIGDGMLHVSLCMIRVCDDGCGGQNKCLALDLSAVDSDGDLYTIRDTMLEIKYCPFCGEEL